MAAAEEKVKSEEGTTPRLRKEPLHDLPYFESTPWREQSALVLKIGACFIQESDLLVKIEPIFVE